MIRLLVFAGFLYSLTHDHFAELVNEHIKEIGIPDAIVTGDRTREFAIKYATNNNISMIILDSDTGQYGSHASLYNFHDLVGTSTHVLVLGTDMTTWTIRYVAQRTLKHLKVID